MTVRYLNFQIQNITGGCYDWFVTLGKEVITGKLDEVKAKAMAYACKQAQKKKSIRKHTVAPWHYRGVYFYGTLEKRVPGLEPRIMSKATQTPKASFFVSCHRTAIRSV